jgi:hypothetical protein
MDDGEGGIKALSSDAIYRKDWERIRSEREIKIAVEEGGFEVLSRLSRRAV